MSEIFSLDVDMLEELSKVLWENEEKSGGDALLAAGTHKMSFNIKAEGTGKLAVLPVNPDEYTGIRVNGQAVEGRAVSGMLTGVPVSEGENFVEINFLPKGQIPGAVITAFMLILMFILYMKEEQLKPVFEAVGKPSYPVVRALWALAVVLIYIVPIAAFVIHQIVKRLF